MMCRSRAPGSLPAPALAPRRAPLAGEPGPCWGDLLHVQHRPGGEPSAPGQAKPPSAADALGVELNKEYRSLRKVALGV